MTAVAKAWTAFGRNDIRGTYRDPLLVMIVIAPIIWTTGVAVLTPRFTEVLAHRYQFDLVGYYALILTAFLLPTSIVIAGGLASFLVLDEVDAGTLTVLRVTSVPLATFFAYRAATVMGVTTVYVIATMSFSGILEPGLPALMPIGLLVGLSAVVTMRPWLTTRFRGWPRSERWVCSSPACRVCHGLSTPVRPSHSACCRHIGLPRRFGLQTTMAPGGRTYSAASSTT